MQQRIEIGVGREVIGSSPEQYVRDEGGHSGDRLSEIGKLRGQHPRIGERNAAEHNEKEGGKDTPGTPFIEGGDRVAAFLQIGDYKGGDQVPAYNEEDIYANKATGKDTQTCMIQDHGQDSDSAQPIYLATILHSLSLQFIA